MSSLMLPLIRVPPLSFHPPRRSVVALSTSAATQKRKGRRRKQERTEDDSSNVLSDASGAEKVLRLVFMEDLMFRAREADVYGVSDVIYDMVAAGLTPGPRSFHGLVVAYALNQDHVGAVTSLKTL